MTLRSESNATSSYGPRDAIFHDQVAWRAAREPDRVAVCCGEDALTFGQLDRLAGALALRLRRAGEGAGTVVGIAMERSLSMVVGMLGILKSGAAYLPLDSTHPVERLSFMLTESAVRVVVTQRAVSARLPASERTIVTLDALSADTDAEVSDPTTSRLEDTAYVMYTSGSTGRPKGVRVLQRNLSNLVSALQVTPGLTSDDVVIAVVPYIFDVSVADLLAPLACGARVVVASQEDTRDPARLGALIERSGGTLMHATPPTWQMLIDSGWEGRARLTAVSAGDVLSEALADCLLDRCAAVWNGYGPTEATVYSTFSRVARGEPVSIGRPLANVRAYVLGPGLQTAPVGVAGELFVAGAGVADGYVHRVEETAYRFIADPFIPGEVMYRTGDRAETTPSGDIVYLGRMDRQVKVRGVRIEPEEIEAVMRSHCNVVDAVVVAQDDNARDRRLVAYYVPNAATPSTAALRRRLTAALPPSMVPSRFVPMQRLPLTANGKIDRAALLQIDDSDVAHALLNTPPSNELEMNLAALWARTLNVRDVRMTDDFFDSGGDSITAVRFVAAVERELGLALPLSIFTDERATLAHIADCLQREHGMWSASEDLLAVTPRSAPLFFVHPYESAMLPVRHFARALADDHKVITLPLRGTRFDHSEGIKELAAASVRSIQAVQPSGPYYLTGYSIGGLVAYEAATQIRASGHQIAWLGLLDTTTPDITRRTAAWMLSPRLRMMRLSRRVLRGGMRRIGNQPERATHEARSRSLNDFDWSGAVRLIARYKCRGVEAPLDLFVSSDEAEKAGSLTLGWDIAHPGTLRVHTVPGDHETMMVEPNVSAVVETVCRSIEQADIRDNAALPSFA